MPSARPRPWPAQTHPSSAGPELRKSTGKRKERGTANRRIEFTGTGKPCMQSADLPALAAGDRGGPRRKKKKKKELAEALTSSLIGSNRKEAGPERSHHF